MGSKQEAVSVQDGLTATLNALRPQTKAAKLRPLDQLAHQPLPVCFPSDSYLLRSASMCSHSATFRVPNAITSLTVCHRPSGGAVFTLNNHEISEKKPQKSRYTIRTPTGCMMAHKI